MIIWPTQDTTNRTTDVDQKIAFWLWELLSEASWGIWNEKWIHPRSFHHGFCSQCSLFKFWGARPNPPKMDRSKIATLWKPWWLGDPPFRRILCFKSHWLLGDSVNLSLNKTASTWLFTSLTYSSTNSAVERGHSFLVFIIVRCMSLYIYYTLYTLYTHMYYVYLCVIITIHITVNPRVLTQLLQIHSTLLLQAQQPAQIEGV